MSLYLPIRAVTRAKKARIGTQQISATADTYVDIDNPSIRKQLSHHSSTGAVYPTGPATAVAPSAAQVTNGLVVSQGTSDSDLLLAVTAGEARKPDGTYVAGAVKTDITIGTAPTEGKDRVDLVSFKLADASYVVTAGTANDRGQVIEVELIKGVATPVNEVQTINVVADSGDFTISFGGETTSALPYNESTANVQTALRAFTGLTPDGVTVTGTAKNYTLTFAGVTKPTAGTNVGPVTTNPAGLGGTGKTAVVTQGAQGTPLTNEQQTITLTNAVGGTFTLTYSGQTTAAIAYNATAATVATRLKALSNIGDNDVTVTGSAGGPYTVTFIGTLANTDVALLTDANSLTTTTSPVAPTTPTGQVPLATVLVENSVTAITDAKITDVRPRV